MKPGLSDYSKFNYRLIQEWEVPKWITVQPEDNKEDEVDTTNGGKRVRKNVIYIDNLTDEQFDNAVEAGEDLQEVMKRDNLRKEKKLVHILQSAN